MPKTTDIIRAKDSEKSEFTVSGPVKIRAAASEGEKKGPRRFDGTAYTGVPMDIEGFNYPVIVDFTGLDGIKGSRPALFNHDSTKIAGHVDRFLIANGELAVSGLMSGPESGEINAAADEGFPWQMSIGAKIVSREFVPAGQTSHVNGKQWSGPLIIARRARMKEVSFVALGADDQTSARIAATAPQKEDTMTFEQWLKAKGFEASTLSDAQRTSLEAMYKVEIAATAKTGADGSNVAATGKTDVKANGATTVAGGAGNDTATAGDDIATYRRQHAEESARIGKVRELCAGGHADIEAKAIAEGWDEHRTKATVLEARLTKLGAPNAIIRDSSKSGQMLQAGVLMSGGIAPEKLEKEHGFKPETIDAAGRAWRNRIGLQELIIEAASLNGYQARAGACHHDLGGVLRAAFSADIRADGFSTYSLSGILSNVANKFLLEGYMNVDTTWQRIASRRPVRDFKTITSYRLTGAFQYDKVGATGELKHGQVGEESYTNSAETYGKMFAITRKDIINDDLGALTAVPQRIGRGAALKMNDVFWTVFLNNSSFFSSGNANYISGGTTVLGIDSLTTLEQKFLDMVDADGKPVAVMPKLLLVPTALFAKANVLMKSTEVRDTTSSTKYGVANPHAGKFEVLSSPYMSNSAYTGYSSTAWYLLADPSNGATIEAALLNGKDTPTVETADADFNVLGIQMRGYHDFGFALQDYRVGAKSAGA